MSNSRTQPPRSRPATPSQESPKDMPPTERKPGGSVRPQCRQKPTPEELTAALEARRVRTNRVLPITFPEALPMPTRRGEIAQAIAAS